MPVETRWFVKAGLLWLLATFAAGGLMLSAKALGIAVPADAAIVHAHMGSTGWLVNLVMGIALWFLPVNRDRFKNNRGRYPAAAAWAVFVLLNLGLGLRIVMEPLFDPSPDSAIAVAALLLSASMQLGAVIIFVFIAWFRVRDVAPTRLEKGVPL
ncbi:MAG: hypothetical protein M3N19_07215 [Candidatus Eremiobacteraeota bacterium]|nr:hypothetical protein [Candidatus Eremiobacteraeota bacterium]